MKNGIMQPLFGKSIVMRRLILIWLGCSIGAHGHAQDKIIGKTLLECRYDAVQVLDTITRRAIDDIMILRIGKTCSAYYSWYKFYADSLLGTDAGQTVLKEMVTIALKSKNPMSRPGARTTNDYLYKGYPAGETTTRTSLLGSYYTFFEKTEPQSWTVCDSVKTIRGYRCHKATAFFRGRSYVAWFTPEIPLPEGPWKFGGLPGLILEVYDTTNDYRFVIRSIRSENIDPVTIYNPLEKRYKKTDRVKFLRRKAELYFQMDADEAMAVSGAGYLGISRKAAGFKPSPAYDFIERDYK